MGGCITPPQAKKSKIAKPEPHSTKPKVSLNSQNDIMNLTIDNSNRTLIENNVKIQKILPVEPPKPKFKKITGQQFIRIYRIEENINTAIRAEGPKYISNYADGIGKVLRVVPFGVQSVLNASTKDVDTQKRVKAYAENLGLQVYEDEQSNLLVLQQYYCGPYLHQVASKNENNQNKREQIRRFLSQVYQIIQSFHQKNIILGNLNIFSFRQTSQFDSTVKLVDLNLVGNLDEAMGHAFKAQKAMDWESFAFIVQTVVGQQTPIFIPHKIQYVQNSNNTVHALLKGRKIKRQQIDNLNFCIPNQNVIIGYKFRSDINRLLKLRKRRAPHRSLYYSEQFITNNEKMADDAIQRIETSKIFDRIQSYVGKLNPQSEQSFNMYCTVNDSLKKLKATFTIKQDNKKMEELKQTLPLIK